MASRDYRKNMSIYRKEINKGYTLKGYKTLNEMQVLFRKGYLSYKRLDGDYTELKEIVERYERTINNPKDLIYLKGKKKAAYDLGYLDYKKAVAEGRIIPEKREVMENMLPSGLSFEKLKDACSKPAFIKSIPYNDDF